MSIWQWTHQFASEARATGDAERVRLASLHQGTFRLMQSNPDEAIAILEEGAALARRLNEPWWALFYEHWKLQALFHKSDYVAALDLAVRCAVEVRKPIYAQLPQRVCLHEDLIRVYKGIDVKGYAPLIQNALDYMDTEIAPGADCRHCHRSLRADFTIQLGQWDKATDETLQCIALVEAEPRQQLRWHFLSACYLMLCEIAFAQERWDEMLEWAKLGEEAARRGERFANLVANLMWQALALRRRGEEILALSRFREATTRKARLGSLPRGAYYEAIVAFHEAGGDLESALRVLDEELEALQDKGQSRWETRRLVKRCALKAEMNLPWHDDRQKAETVARRLADPAPILHELELLSQRYPSQ